MIQWEEQNKEAVCEEGLLRPSEDKQGSGSAKAERPRPQDHLREGGTSNGPGKTPGSR